MGRHCCPGPLQNFPGDGAKTEAAHACGRAGKEERMEDIEGRLQSRSRAKRGEAGGSYTVPNKSPWTGLRKKESLGGNERIKQAVCPHMVGHYLFCMTDIH